MDNISHNIKQLRIHLKLTQSQFASKIGNKVHNIGAWEEGRATPSYKILQQIANIFSIPLTDLIETEIDENYFSRIDEQPAVYFNKESQSAVEFVRFLQEELKEKNKVIKALLEILKEGEKKE